jgi:hypothetical protein
VLPGVHDQFLVPLAEWARNCGGLNELRPVSDYRDYAHGGIKLIMSSGPVRAASGAAKVVGGIARHAAWWLRYRLNGDTHPAPPEPKRRTAPPRRSAE